MSESTTLGSRIREIRLQKGITQADLSKGLCTPSMISQIESERARPSYKIMFGIAERLDVPMEKLLKNVVLGMEYIGNYKLAMAMVRAGEYNLAIPLLEGMMKLPTPQLSLVGLQFELGICQLGIGQFDNAAMYFEIVKEWALHHQQYDRLALTLMKLGLIAKHKKEYQIAIYHTQRAIEELAKSAEVDDVLQSQIFGQLAEIHREIGQVEEAAKYFEMSLKLGGDNLEEKANICLNLARAYQQLEDFQRVELYSSKAIALLEQVQEQQQQLEWQYQLLLLNANNENWTTTVSEMLQFTQLYSERTQKCKIGEIYVDVANLYLEHGEFDEAWSCAEQAHLLLPHDHAMMGKVYRVFAFVCLERDRDLEKGSKYIDNAVSIFKRSDRLAENEEMTIQFCESLVKRGEYREAYERIGNLHRYMVTNLHKKGIVL